LGESAPAILAISISRYHSVDRGKSSGRRAIGADWKGKISPALYLTGLAAAFYAPRLAQSLYVLVALLWLVPDRRIEQLLLGK
jgi:hypothetical protein